MAIVSISKAAKLVRKGRQTLYNHNEKGKLSFTKTEDGKPGIDTSELERVYGKLYMPANKLETVVQHNPPNSDKPGQAGSDNTGSQVAAETQVLNLSQRMRTLSHRCPGSLNKSIRQSRNWQIHRLSWLRRDNTLAELRKAIAVLPSPESVEQRMAEQADQLARQHNDAIETEREQLAQVLAEQRRREAHQHKKWEQSIADRKAEIQQAREEAAAVKQRQIDQAAELQFERDRVLALESRGLIARLLNKKSLQIG